MKHILCFYLALAIHRIVISVLLSKNSISDGNYVETLNIGSVWCAELLWLQFNSDTWFNALISGILGYWHIVDIFLITKKKKKKKHPTMCRVNSLFCNWRGSSGLLNFFISFWQDQVEKLSFFCWVSSIDNQRCGSCVDVVADTDSFVVSATTLT